MTAGRLDGREFISGYLAEAEELLATSSRSLIAIEEAYAKGVSARKPVRELFRALHTLKGVSAMVGAEPIVELSHEMENALRVTDESGGRLPKAALDACARALEAVRERVDALARGEALPGAPRELLEVLASAAAHPSGPLTTEVFALPDDLASKLSAADVEEIAEGVARGLRAVRVDFYPSSERAARGIGIARVRETLTELGEIVRVFPRSAEPGDPAPGGIAFVLILLTQATDELLAAAADTTPDTIRTLRGGPREALEPETTPVEALEGAERNHDRSTIRVEVGRMDELLELLDGLVVSRARIEREMNELRGRGADVRALRLRMGEHGRQIRGLRGAVLRARMVPLAQVLERAPLLLRGLSKNLGKSVRLAIDVKDVEVDKAVGDRITPAIVHLLRNAVDHGIEEPIERRALGKSEEGRISIVARESAGLLELAVEDDGRGIDRAKLAGRAGVPVPATDGELLDLVTRAGLSTASQATATSGRGIGMDIVRKIVVDQLGGDLGLVMRPGAGTRFSLRVPLSVAILDVLSLEAGGQRFLVPVATVDELAEIDRKDIVEPPASSATGARAGLLLHRGEALPIVALGPALGLTGGSSDRTKVVVVRREGERVAFQVDKTLGKHEVVVRPVPDPLVHVPAVQGSADLGDGRPTLVLDLPSLARRTVTRKEAAL